MRWKAPKTLTRAIVLASVLALALPWAVLADDVYNNLDSTIDAELEIMSLTVGSTDVTTYSVKPRNGDGKNGCNITGGTYLEVSVNSSAPSVATASLVSNRFTSCDAIVTVTVTAVGAGEATMTLTETGNTAQGSFDLAPATFKVVAAAPQPADEIPPTITPTISGTLGNNGWYVSDVTVTWLVTDDESDITITSGCDETVINYDTGGETLTCEATSAGGTASESVTIKRDATPPTIALAGGPEDGASYYYGDTPPAPTCAATDNLSGVDGECTIEGYGTTVGMHTLRATATDKAGNAAKVEVTYTVLAWTLDGFFTPVNMGEDVYNTVKGGSTVPLKFRVFKGETELTDPAVVASITATACACTAGMSTTDVDDATATGSTVLRYDWDGSQFIYNWKTPKSPGTCYKVTVTTQDGSSLPALFKLK